MRNQKRLNDIVDHFKYLNPQTRENKRKIYPNLWVVLYDVALFAGRFLNDISVAVRQSLGTVDSCRRSRVCSFNVRASAWTWPVS